MSTMPVFAAAISLLQKLAESQRREVATVNAETEKTETRLRNLEPQEYEALNVLKEQKHDQ